MATKQDNSVRCTSLVYRDVSDDACFGRTLELTSDHPYQIVYLPAGVPICSGVAGHPELDHTGKHPFLAVTMPARMPTTAAPLGLADLKVLEGINDQGLTFSLLSYPTASGPQAAVAATQAVLSASDLGSWALSQFATVAEVKQALAAQPVMLEPLAQLGGVESPFLYVVHDAGGNSFVIEFDGGVMKTHENPVGVMTDGPALSWHLTNLNNYGFLNNVDRSGGTFGTLKVVQPASGIATAGLPSSNTSVGRFVRAAHHAQFAEKATIPDAAVQALAHTRNNFDRPRGVSIGYPSAGGGHLEVAGREPDSTTSYATEFTSWTNLSDLSRRLFLQRTYHSINFTVFDLNALAAVDRPCILPLSKLDGLTVNSTDALKASRTA